MSSHLDVEAAQQTSHKIGSASFSKSQLRVLVEIPTPSHELRRQAFGLDTEFRNSHDSLNPP
jgi:hypothetical protein